MRLEILEDYNKRFTHFYAGMSCVRCANNVFFSLGILVDPGDYRGDLASPMHHPRVGPRTPLLGIRKDPAHLFIVTSGLSTFGPTFSAVPGSFSQPNKLGSFQCVQ